MFESLSLLPTVCLYSFSNIPLSMVLYSTCYSCLGLCHLDCYRPSSSKFLKMAEFQSSFWQSITAFCVYGFLCLSVLFCICYSVDKASGLPPCFACCQYCCYKHPVPHSLLMRVFVVFRMYTQE